MKKDECVKTLLFVLCLHHILLPSDVYAYLDPGTGSLILQMIIAGFFGVSFAIKVYWKKIKAFWGNQRNVAKGDRKEND